MAGPSFSYDSFGPLLLTSSTNAIDIFPSGAGTGASSSTYYYNQSLNFNILRQDIIIPNGTYTDPRVTTSAGGAFTCTPTHNRLLIQCNVNFASYIGPNPSGNLPASHGAVPMIFSLWGAASGASGSGYYTTGPGHVMTYSGGYAWRPAVSTDIQQSISRSLTFTLDLMPGSYSSNFIITPINQLIRRVAKYVKLNSCSQLDLTLIRY